jgi:hypothetical protein
VSQETSAERLWQHVKNELERDDVPVSRVIWRFRRAFPQLDEQPLRAAVMDFIDRLLGDDGVTFGNFERGGEFVVHTSPPAAISAGIADEWAEMGRDPLPGEIGWFRGIDSGLVVE